MTVVWTVASDHDHLTKGHQKSVRKPEEAENSQWPKKDGVIGFGQENVVSTKLPQMRQD